MKFSKAKGDIGHGRAGDLDRLKGGFADLNICNGYIFGQLITAARSYISREGITLTESVEDGMLVEMYAAYLYRRRREENVQMPRMLRWALNNRLFSQKARGT